MGNPYCEWWKQDITNKFEILAKVLQLVVLVCLPITLYNSYFYSIQLGQCSLAYVLFIIPSFSKNSTVWFKAAFVILLSECVLYLVLDGMQGESKEYATGYVITSVLILICLQKPFMFSVRMTVFLFLKLQYQVYIKHFLSADPEVPTKTSPVTIIIFNTILFTYYSYLRKNTIKELLGSLQKVQKTKTLKKMLFQLIPGGFILVSDRLSVIKKYQNSLRTVDINLLAQNLTEITYYPNKKMNSLNTGNSLWDDIRDSLSIELNEERLLGITSVGDQFLEWRVKKILWVDKTVLVLLVRQVNELIQLERQTAENNIKSAILSTTTHELRTPAFAINAYTEELIEDERTLPEHKEKLEIVQSSSSMLLILINDILDFSRIITGNFSIHKTMCDPAILLQECWEIIKIHAERKGLKMVLSIDPLIPSSIMIDPTRLKQILLNLLSNALKFTIRGHVKLVACLTYSGNIRVEVIDTGIGIPPDRLESIFEAFNSQSDAFYNPLGCGLGLNVSNQLAIALGNSPIRVESVLGHGSTFSFRIFCGGGEEELVSNEEETEVSEGNLNINFNGYNLSAFASTVLARILVVDDLNMNRDILGAVLRNYDLAYCEAANGSEAVEIIQSRNAPGQSNFVKVVLMDIEMPGLNGIEATRQILDLATQGFELPIVIGLTAHTANDVIQDCFASGMKKVLPKPCQTSLLIQTVREFI